MKYTFGGTSFTRTSNSVSFQILATSTLPGTGGIELPAAQPRMRAEIPAFSAAALTGIICLALIVFGIWARQRQPEWSRWAMKMGMLLGVTAILFGVAGWGLYTYTAGMQGKQASLQPEAPAHATQEPRLLVHTPEAMIWPDVLPQIPGSELDQLPDFPIPSPTLTAASQGESAADASPVNRIIIPALALDTVVKYVPFDGITWMIAGLQQEVAWMGDTSWPGLGGNTALAGHVTLRTGVNGPFRYISDLQNGDSIFIHTDEKIYEYKVREQDVVEATDLSILEPSQESILTLITCTNFDPGTGFYTMRLAVTADLVNVREQELAARGN
jgi:LPXTG-site transpeptidase (sortase) family protein